jgi:hypothetical protein
VLSEPDGGQNVNAMKLGVFWGIISLCGVTILTGILGFFTARYKSCCTISFFSFLTLILRNLDFQKLYDKQQPSDHQN